MGDEKVDFLQEGVGQVEELVTFAGGGDFDRELVDSVDECVGLAVQLRDCVRYE